MALRTHILIDATPGSQVPLFDQNPVFQRWLHCFSTIDAALEFINKITRPYTIQVYLARDNLLDNVPSISINGPPRTLIQTLTDLITIHHVRVFCPTVDADSLQQILNATIDPRLMDPACSVIDLPCCICSNGITYFEQEITRNIFLQQENLLPNIQETIGQLMKYLQTSIDERRTLIENLEEARFNQLGQEAS
jgi:hypothetical protein